VKRKNARRSDNFPRENCERKTVRRFSVYFARAVAAIYESAIVDARLSVRAACARRRFCVVESERDVFKYFPYLFSFRRPFSCGS